MVIVKLIFVAMSAILLASCDRATDDALMWNNKKTIIELRHRLELLNYQTEIVSSRESHQVIEDDAEATHEEISAILLMQRSLQKEVIHLRNGWEEYRKSILESRRAQVSSKTFEVFEAADGRQFQNARVTQIDDTGVSMTHADGTARLRFDDLAPQWHSYFGLDGDFARTAQQKEIDIHNAYEYEMNRQLAAISKSEAEQRKVRIKEEERLASARAVAASARAKISSPLSASIGDLGDTSKFYSRRYHRSFSGYYSRPTVRYSYTNYTNYCPPFHSHIQTWNPASSGSATGICVSPVQNQIPSFQPNP